LKEAEERVQSIEAQQQEYLAFRRQLNTIYNDALGYLQRKNYSRGIEKLRTLLPLIEGAREKGIGNALELKVEEDLVNNILYLAEREQNRIDLDQVGQKTLEAAQLLEREGKLKEALSRYYTVYTISSNDTYKDTAMKSADAIMDQIYRDRTESERKELERKADQLFQSALVYKKGGNYERALEDLETIITDVSVKTRNRRTLDEIVAVNKLWALKEEEKERNRINEKAAAEIRSAAKSYGDGYYTQALQGYEAVLMNYRESDYAEEALVEITRINKEMRGLKLAPPRSFKQGDTDSGVIIQALGGANILFNLGSDNNVKDGDVLQVYRKEDGEFVFIGSVKVLEVYPRLSKGKIVYSEEVLKVGDIVAF
jgi:tetratricopeptide (TPR) repeat protein